MADSPFPDWWLKKDVDKRSIGKSLARILKPFGVKAKKFRIKGEQIRGYDRSDLELVWERYCRSINSTRALSGDLDVSDVPANAIDSLPAAYARTSGVGGHRSGTSSFSS